MKSFFLVKSGGQFSKLFFLQLDLEGNYMLKPCEVYKENSLLDLSRKWNVQEKYILV